MKQVLFIIIAAFIALPSFAKEEEKESEDKQLKVSFSGYIKNDFFYDTRQTIAAREGQFLLWPSPRVADAQGYDINANPSFNFLAVQSRIAAAISGPDALGAKTSGLLEGDFFAQANDNINLFRLRHAYIKLNWENTELLTGQYWNPMFVVDCFPGTISFNSGAPIQGLARNPQIRLSHKIRNVKLIVAALGQRDFTDNGPQGKSSAYLRNSGMPEVQAQAHVSLKGLKFGGGIAYKTLTPRLSSDYNQKTHKVDEKVTSLSAMAFAKITTQPVTIKLHAKYGENNSDMLAPSGYAVQAIVNQETGKQAYTPLTNVAFWSEIHTNGKKFQAGIFAGVLKNNGTRDEIDASFADKQIVYGLGQDIETICRVSPHAFYNAGSLRLAMEVEYTTADYGSNYDLNWKPENTQKVENCRILCSVYYFF